MGNANGVDDGIDLAAPMVAEAGQPRQSGRYDRISVVSPLFTLHEAASFWSIRIFLLLRA